MIASTDLTLTLAAVTEVSERHETAEPDKYATETLAEAETRDTSLQIDFDGEDDAPVWSIAWRAWHVVNPETGRGFHAEHKAQLSGADMRALRDFLTFALEHPRGSG